MSAVVHAPAPDAPAALLLVRHETRLAYDGPVVQGHSEVRKVPVDTGLQRVRMAKLSVHPPTVLRSHRDYFGNHVHRLNLLEAHDELALVAESVVETRDAIACGPEAVPDPRPWPERWAEFLHPSPAVPPLSHYDAIENDVRPDLPPDEFVAALDALGATFLRTFRYAAGVTDVHSTPEVLFEQGAGVCQDFTHAMIGVLRRARVPARYASGYLYDPAHGEGDSALRGTAASHAWVQAWHPGLGWVGVDPTNDKLVDWQYVRVAVGRDYLDVQPVRGVFHGEGGQRLSVSVEVTRLSGGPGPVS